MSQATHGAHLRSRSLADLAEATDWLRDNWSEQRDTPLALHEPHTTDGALGGLRYSGAFIATLGWKPETSTRVVATVACHHPLLRRRQEAVDCPECQGDGWKDVNRDRYPYPMSRALALLARSRVRPGTPHPLAIIYAYASNGWRRLAVARLLDLDDEQAGAALLRAIRQLHLRYRAGPVDERPTWVDLSDSQRAAIEEGEALQAGVS